MYVVKAWPRKKVGSPSCEGTWVSFGVATKAEASKVRDKLALENFNAEVKQRDESLADWCADFALYAFGELVPDSCDELDD